MPIWFIAWITAMFVYLLYETDFCRVNLMPRNSQPNRKWQFIKYGDESLILCTGCGLTCSHHSRDDRWFGWQIPARTVKAFSSTMHFNEGCNYQRAGLLRDIYKAQKSRTKPHYRQTPPPSSWYPSEEATIELLVDGKPIASFDGDYKRGVIKSALKPYTTRARIGHKAFNIPVGEADRVTA